MQIFALLGLGTVAPNLVHAQIRMRAIGKADRGRRARYLLHRDAMREIAEPRPAVFLFDRNAVQPERAHLGPEIARKFVVAVDLVGARRNPVLREIGDGVAQHVGLGTEAKIETGPGIRNHRKLHRSGGPDPALSESVTAAGQAVSAAEVPCAALLRCRSKSRADIGLPNK